MAAANEGEVCTMQLIRELATAYYNQPVSVLIYNDISSHFSKKHAAIFAAASTSTPTPIAIATSSPAPLHNTNPSDVDYSAVATRLSQNRWDASRVRLLTTKSAHRQRFSALEALLEALEDVIGRALAGLPVESTKTYAVGGNL